MRDSGMAGGTVVEELKDMEEFATVEGSRFLG